MTAPSRPPLPMDKHPFEVLEHIVAELDRPKDLLALALSSRTFPDIIIPHYIEFRDIRCDPHRTTLWNSLAARPHLAARIRRLELIPEYAEAAGLRPPNIKRKPIIPGQFADMPLNQSELRDVDGKKTDECFLALAAAVKEMCGLVRFRWERNHTCSPTLGSVFASLIESGAPIKELGADLFDDNHGGWPRRLFGKFINEIWCFSNLTKVSVEVGQKDGLAPIPEQGRKITQMLIARCPSIQELNINFCDRPAFDELLEDGHWPMLTRLTIGERAIPYYNNYIHATMYSVRMRHFLKRHDNIECLCLKGKDALWPGALQEAPMDADCEVLLLETKMLRSCVAQIQHGFSPGLIKHKHLPKLERLSITVSDITPYVDGILELTHLTHLEGVHEIIDTHSQGLALLEKLAILPKLTYIKVTVNGQFRWVTLERDQGGHYTGVWHVTRKTEVRGENLRSTEWGGYRRLLFD
ncbi:hypothetical protein BU17DRAFT_71532 [Hysterangium stoloniferum]|nr:hypothetical protein BU17DRAFT_71532 [Hysterangium stoloniferum]